MIGSNKQISRNQLQPCFFLGTFYDAGKCLPGLFETDLVTLIGEIQLVARPAVWEGEFKERCLQCLQAITRLCGNQELLLW